MINRPYEVIIVGSGATGGVAAQTFAENGVKVLIIESGSELTPDEAIGSEPINTFRRLRGLLNGEHRIQAQHPGFWKSNPLLYANEKESRYKCPKDKPFIWTQGRQIGGRSLTWGGITLRLSDRELQSSNFDGYGPSWPIKYNDLAPHYSAVEKSLKIYGNKDNLYTLPDGEYSEPLPFTTAEKDFTNRIQNSLGYKVIHSRGFGPHTKESGNKWPKSSSLGSSLDIARKTGNIQILSSHIVEKIIMNKQRNLAKGVIAIDKSNGNRIKLEANLVVLCASTIQSVKLLLNSEEKNETNGFIESSKTLGLYLMDHISICRFFMLPMHRNLKEINSNKLSGAGSFFIPFGQDLDKSDSSKFIRGYGIWGGIDRFELPIWINKATNKSLGFLIGHGEVLPNSNNKITLSDDPDKWGIPQPNIEMKWNENEIKMSKHMKQTIEKIICSAEGKIINFNELVDIPVIQKILGNAVAIQENPPPPGYYIHEVGGARMGNTKEDSVLDKWNRLWNCKNVLVVDGSCWPTSGWQSPTLTMMAIARRACLNAINSQSD